MYSNALSSPTGGVRDANQVRLVRAALLVLFTYVFLVNAWMGDDAHTTFRTVWNFVHGYGLTFNPDERVQAYTHPLWMFVVSAAHFVTREFFFTVTTISWAFSLAAGIILLRRARSIGMTALMVVWLISSKALIDYTSSGLEYPLSYFLLALFYSSYLERPVDRPVSNRDLRFFVLVAAFAFVNRADTALLYILPLGEMFLRTLRLRGKAALAPAAIGSLPAVLWLAFATFYYGFPLPNTYYAKVANGIPTWLQHEQGWAYFFNSINHDPITLGTIALALLISWRIGGAALRTALSAALYVAYTISVGGDFMSGRFFAMPFLISVMTVMPEFEGTLVPWAGGALILYNLLMPIVPIKVTASYDQAWPWRNQNGIKDEHGITHQGSNLLAYAPFHFNGFPDTPYGREGISFAAAQEKSAVYCCIGIFGINAGPAKHIIDENALSDPLLARLPVSPRVYMEFWASHYFRDIPDGYLESTERDQNLLTDPLLHEYYEKLRNVTRGSVFRWSRLRDIWSLNVDYRHLQDEYEKNRSVSMSFQAIHDRFPTDVGFKDVRTGTIQATGRAGYLQYGPGIPLKAGYFRARWIGSVDDAPGGQVGFVEIWNGGERLKREPVAFSGPRKDHHLAQIDFELKEPARAVDYRLYVNNGVKVTLERVELFSGQAIPPNDLGSPPN